MDLSSPLRSLTPTLDSAVLEVLAGTESGLGIGQIVRLAGRGSRQGLTLALDRLVDHGLVHAQPANRGYLYRLNREHVLADAVLTAARTRIVILTRLEAGLKLLEPHVIHASVFGSFARREAGPDSDIDLLVVLPGQTQADDAWFGQLRSLGDQVLAWTGNRMEYVALTEEELGAVVANREPILNSWMADSVTVLGAPIESVVRGLAILTGGHRS